MLVLILAGCSGGGGSGTGTVGYGTITMDITDAKPFIDPGPQPDELNLVIEEVLVHQTGGGWISLMMPENPFEINLLAFYDGMKTQLVPPSPIPAGDITQIRMVISSAYMVFYNDPGADVIEPIDLDVPSGKLRTDKKCGLWMGEGDALRITIHFDLSQSVVKSGDVYKLKPVIHLFDNNLDSAYTICGNITTESFLDPPEQVVATVNYVGPDTDGEIPYTKVWITKDEEDEFRTYFCVYWLVPLPSDDESYVVRLNRIGDSELSFEEPLTKSDLEYYTVLESFDGFPLNEGEDITIPLPPPPPE
jgi:hypothetical protein